MLGGGVGLLEVQDYWLVAPSKFNPIIGGVQKD